MAGENDLARNAHCPECSEGKSAAAKMLSAYTVVHCKTTVSIESMVSRVVRPVCTVNRREVQ